MIIKSAYIKTSSNILSLGQDNLIVYHRFKQAGGFIKPYFYGGIYLQVLPWYFPWP